MCRRVPVRIAATPLGLSSDRGADQVTRTTSLANAPTTTFAPGSEPYDDDTEERSTQDIHCNVGVSLLPGWQMFRDRGTGGPRKVRVFSERMAPEHTLFSRETYYCRDLRAL